MPKFGTGRGMGRNLRNGRNAPTRAKASETTIAIANSKPCPEGQVRNPLSGRCIKIDGPTYKTLVRKGIVTNQV